MHVNDMTRKQFEELPWRESWSKDVECTSLVILPLRRKHDSGYRCMDFVAVQNGEPICRVAGGSDVINLDGIGGYGEGRSGTLPRSVPPRGWSIDCLPKSGLLHIFSSYKLRCGLALSSFELFAIGGRVR